MGPDYEKDCDSMTSEDRTVLRVFMPGAFAGMPERIGQEYNTRRSDVALDFHAFIPSGELARKILSGAEADVYVSANRRYMDELQQAGLVRDPRALAGNRLCIIVRPDRQADVADLEDLTRPGVRLVTPQSGSDPCGQYIVEMFERAGLTSVMQDKEQSGELVHSFGSGDLPGYLFDGRVDAGVFYASEAQAIIDSVVVRDLPVELDMRERIEFMIGAVERSEDENADAREFVEFMCGDDGQALLEEHGFLGSSGEPGKP
jgi:molybdate transport system substrate-binding protein